MICPWLHFPRLKIRWTVRGLALLLGVSLGLCQGGGTSSPRDAERVHRFHLLRLGAPEQCVAPDGCEGIEFPSRTFYETLQRAFEKGKPPEGIPHTVMSGRRAIFRDPDLPRPSLFLFLQLPTKRGPLGPEALSYFAILQPPKPTLRADLFDGADGRWIEQVQKSYLAKIGSLVEPIRMEQGDWVLEGPTPGTRHTLRVSGGYLVARSEPEDRSSKPIYSYFFLPLPRSPDLEGVGPGASARESD